MKLLKSFFILGALVLGAIGVLAILEIIKQEEAVIYGQKAFGVLVVLAAASFVVSLVMGKAKETQTVDKSKQGPQF